MITLIRGLSLFFYIFVYTFGMSF